MAVSKEYLKKIGALQDTAPAKVAAPAPATPDLTEAINVLAKHMADLNSLQFDRLAEILKALGQQQPPTVTTIEVPTPRPCTLKVKRDSKGFIDSIDVLPKE